MRAAHRSLGATHHRLSNFVIDVDGDRATARSYVHAVLLLVPGDSAHWVETIGSYDDTFVRAPAGWRISRRVAHTARTLTSGAPPAAQAPGE
jgi:hypothetical protein